MSHWKKGGYPSGDIIIRFAQYFNVSTDYLLGLTDNPSVTPPKGEVINKNVEENEKMEEKRIPRFAALHYDEKLYAFGRECKNIFVILEKEGNENTKEMCRVAKNFINIFNRDYEALQKFYDEIFQTENCLKEHEYKYLKPDEVKENPLTLTIERLLGKAKNYAGEPMTDEDLAIRMDVDIISIISWRSGEREPIWENLERLGAILGFESWVMDKYRPKLEKEQSAVIEKLSRKVS